MYFLLLVIIAGVLFLLIAHSPKNYPQTFFPIISSGKKVTKKDKYTYVYSDTGNETSLDLRRVTKLSYVKHRWYGTIGGAPQTYDLSFYTNEQETPITFINFSKKAFVEVLDVLSESGVVPEEKKEEPTLTIGGFRL